jgi:hypothetical protein
MELPGEMHAMVWDTVCRENSASIETARAAERRSLWVVVLGLAPYRDEGRWYYAWGDVLASGETPEDAAQAFEREVSPTPKAPEPTP